MSSRSMRELKVDEWAPAQEAARPGSGGISCLDSVGACWPLLDAATTPRDRHVHGVVGTCRLVIPETAGAHRRASASMRLISIYHQTHSNIALDAPWERKGRQESNFPLNSNASGAQESIRCQLTLVDTRRPQSSGQVVVGAPRLPPRQMRRGRNSYVGTALLESVDLVVCRRLEST